MLARLMSLLVAGLLLTPAPLAAQSATGAVRGTVLDARTLQPLENVAVYVDRNDDPIRTDLEGRFELDGLAAGRHDVYLSIIGYILVKRDFEVRAGETTNITVPLTEGAGTYTEEVRVTPASDGSPAPLVAAQQILGSAELQNLRGVLTDDPMRAVQALPGVTANDDLRAELAVRGSDFRHVGVLVDGVESQALMHAVRGTQDGGSIAMVNSDVLERASLLAGSYPQRFGNRTGAQIEFAMRPGSRDRTQVRASVSGTSASAVAEGPIGSSRKGSWLFATRKSYLDLIINAVTGRTDVDLGFVDAQAKLAYDFTPKQRLETTVVAGRSQLHDNPATAASSTIVDGAANAGLASLAWIATPTPKLIVTQRLSVEASRFKNDNRSGLELDSDDRDGYAYRVDVLHMPSADFSYEGGVQARHLSESLRLRRPSAATFNVRDAYDADAQVFSGFMRTSRTFGPRWAIEAGARVDTTSLTGDTVASPWFGVQWRAPRGLLFRAGSGLYHQFADFDQVAGSRGSARLEAERATHVDASVEQALGAGVFWRAVLFGRDERDYIRLADLEPRMIGGRVGVDPLTTKYDNRLDGRSRGVELMLQRKRQSGISGWLSYSYARTLQRDRVTGEAFRADFDQRHTFNAYALQRLSNRLSVAAKVRAGSGTPLIGYFEQRGGNVYLSATRNAVQLPPYLRIDLRANQTFNWKRSRLTLFAEVINVMNRANIRQSGAGINRTTGLVSGIFDTMAPIVPSLGLLVEF